MKKVSGSVAVFLSFAAALAWSGPARAFFAETAVQSHQGDHTSNPTDPYSGNGVFTKNQGVGQNSTTTIQDFTDDIEFGGQPQREEHGRGTADLTTSQVKARVSGAVRVASLPGGAITLALAAMSDSASLSRPGGPPFGQRSGDVVTFTLHLSGTFLENNSVPGSGFNPSYVALIIAQPGGITPNLAFTSPNYLCTSYWGIGADAQVNLPLVSKLSSFPATLTVSCPTGPNFDWAVYIRPIYATFNIADWNFDFGSTLDVSVHVPDDVTFESTGSGFVPPSGPAPVTGATDHYLSYKTSATKGSICSTDATANVGGVCQVEEDCGGMSDGDTPTDVCIPNKFQVTDVTVTDSLEPETRVYEVRKPLALYTPADKNNEGIHDPDTHLRSYSLGLPKVCTAAAPANQGMACKKESECGATTKGTKFCQAQPKSVKHLGLTVTDQFGTRVIDALKPDRLLVPTSKGLTAPLPSPSGVNVNHYKCYTIALTKGSPKFTTIAGVSVADQFTQVQFPSGKKLFDLKKLTHLCLPANKNGEGIVNPTGSLLCYQASATKGQPKHKSVKGLFLANQLDVEQADTISEDELCVPADLGQNSPA